MRGIFHAHAGLGALVALLAGASLAGAPSCGGGVQTPRRTSTAAAAAPAAAPTAAPQAAGGGGAVGVPFEHGSPWPKFRGNAAQDGRSAVKPSLTGGALWSFPTGRGVFSSPVVAADGTVYLGSADRIFYALRPDGTKKWSLLTGEIIDSAGLLDDRGRVYFGSGDGKLRALDAATGALVWAMDADPPSKSSAFINWFEGNVALGPSGALYVPNDNFFVYAVDRDTGAPLWRYKMPDQTWSLPAIDPTKGTLFVGNNNLLPSWEKNTFAIDADGGTVWEASSLGTVAASPVLTADGKVVVGGFDGYVHAYDARSGAQLWQTATRDHVYASAALLPDGTIVVPSCDASLYALDPANGAVKWAFDMREPIRSSPAVDGAGNVYFGSGEGRLFVVNPDGTLRWSMLLVDADRNDLNASPALGADAIYLGGESGEIFSVPYDYCLRPMSQNDPRCSTGEGLPGDGATLLFTSAFGALLSTPPASIDTNQPLAFTLLVRAKGNTQLATLDPASLAVTVTPPVATDVQVSGDGKFLIVTPQTAYTPGAGGAVQVSITGNYLVDLDRTGLKLSGGTVGGAVTGTFSFALTPPSTYPLPLPVPQMPGDPAGVWEVSRLSLPLPTILPSYNQIGFDSLLYLVGLVEGSGTQGVAWMAGSKLLDTSNTVVIDPATQALVPLAFSYDGGALTLQNPDGISVEVMNAVIPLASFRMAAHVGTDGTAAAGVRIDGSTVCAGVPMYGPFLETLGFCNPQTDLLVVLGGANMAPYNGGTQQAPAGVGTVSFGATASAVSATVTGSSVVLADHVAAVLLVDTQSGAPVSLDYGLVTTRTAAPDGTLSSVSVDCTGKTLPAQVRAYLMIDTYPAAVTTLTLP